MTFLFNVSPNILDAETIADLQELGHDTIVELFDIFFSEVRHEIADLETAFNLGKRDQIYSLAHRLKGSCLNLGASAMGASCLDIENASKQNNLDGISLLIKQLYQSFELTEQEMKTLLAT